MADLGNIEFENMNRITPQSFTNAWQTWRVADISLKTRGNDIPIE
jgi:hypothetical protein